MRYILIYPLLVTLIISCSDTDSAKSRASEIEVLDLNTHIYKISFRNMNYLILLDEYDFYLMLEKLKVVRNQREFFSSKNRLMNSPVKLDSSNFMNYSSTIVFIDSSNKYIVNSWVEKIKKNPTYYNQCLNMDTTLNKVDLNSIYYKLIIDSFIVHRDDVSGYYVIKKFH